MFVFRTQKKGYICYTCSMNKHSDNTSRAYPIRFFLFLLAILFALHSKPTNAAEMPLAGRNVLYIHLESFQNFMIGQTLNGIPITPNLNTLITQGLWFSHCYPQVAGGNTSDAEFMVHTSLLPASKGAVFNQFTSGSYHSIGNILKKKGYNTAVFHGNTANVWNRPAMYPALGLDRFDSAAQYAPGLKIGLGLADRPFYTETAHKLLTLKEPFFADVLSLSGHSPFKIPISEDNFNPAPYTGTVFGDYLRAIHYADGALGLFIAELRHSGLLEKSLAVIYGDHGGLPLSEYERLEHFLNNSQSGQTKASSNTIKPALWRARTQVPLLFLAHGAIMPASVGAPVGQVDIAHTVAAMMGAEMPGSVGTNLMHGVPPFVAFRGGSIIKEDLWITNVTDSGAEVYNLANGNLLLSGKEGRLLFSGTIKRAIKMLEASDKVLEQHR